MIHWLDESHPSRHSIGYLGDVIIHRWNWKVWDPTTRSKLSQKQREPSQVSTPAPQPRDKHICSQRPSTTCKPCVSDWQGVRTISPMAQNHVHLQRRTGLWTTNSSMCTLFSQHNCYFANNWKNWYFLLSKVIKVKIKSNKTNFYRAMHFSAKRSIAIACRLSVRLSVCNVGELWSVICYSKS